MVSFGFGFQNFDFKIGNPKTLLKWIGFEYSFKKDNFWEILY
jgi:hypothetical protein